MKIAILGLGSIGRRHLGNFPQAFTHVALVNTAFNLDRETAEPPMTQRSPQEPAEAY